eukprot:GFKZ01014663.1.p1 GENE.GFKZ01014663.1~~GFKZ01014663.1.p1  ORF type:complete len:383 (-),score=42.70 GFKZ01014663.1:1613-2761(-)
MASSHTRAIRVVVTGATGFIGRKLLTDLRRRHPKVIPIALTRPSSDVISLQRLLDYPIVGPTVLKASFDDIAALEHCVKNADVVIHLAAEMDFFPSDSATLIRANVDGTRNVLEACAKESARRGTKIRFVYVSSTEAVGCTDGMGKADESAPRRPDSDYGHSKVAAEDLVAKYAGRLQTVVARPTGVFGPDERFFFFEMMQMVASGISIVAPSPMTGKLMFTHVDDVVQGLILCATHPQAVGGVFHICPDESVTNRQIIEKMADVLKIWRPALYLSLPLGKLLIQAVAPVMNFRKKRVFIYHPKTVAQSVKDREYSNERLRKLGYVPKYSILSGTEQALLFEMNAGTVKRHFVPSAMKACINFAGCVAFVLRRYLRQQYEET